MAKAFNTQKRLRTLSNVNNKWKSKKKRRTLASASHRNTKLTGAVLQRAIRSTPTADSLITMLKNLARTPKARVMVFRCG